MTGGGGSASSLFSYSLLLSLSLGDLLARARMLVGGRTMGSTRLLGRALLTATGWKSHQK